MENSLIARHLRRLKKEVLKMESGNVVHQRDFVALELELMAQGLEE